MPFWERRYHVRPFRTLVRLDDLRLPEYLIVGLAVGGCDRPQDTLMGELVLGHPQAGQTGITIKDRQTIRVLFLRDELLKLGVLLAAHDELATLLDDLLVDRTN